MYSFIYPSGQGPSLSYPQGKPQQLEQCLAHRDYSTNICNEYFFCNIFILFILSKESFIQMKPYIDFTNKTDHSRLFVA